MYTFVLGLTIVVGTPGLKDPPKKETGIDGEWIPESISMAGKLAKAPVSGLRYEFTADGKWIIKREGSESKARPSDYKADVKANPATIDVIYPQPPAGAPPVVGGAGPQGMLGIYKIEDDTLTICFAARGGDRPISFDPNDGARTMVIVLKRAKKKE